MSLRKIKKRLLSGSFWGVQATLFGGILGLPFIVAGKNWVSYVSSLTFIQGVLIFFLTVFAGFFIENYVRKWRK